MFIVFKYSRSLPMWLVQNENGKLGAFARLLRVSRPPFSVLI